METWIVEVTDHRDSAGNFTPYTFETTPQDLADWFEARAAQHPSSYEFEVEEALAAIRSADFKEAQRAVRPFDLTISREDMREVHAMFKAAREGEQA